MKIKNFLANLCFLTSLMLGSSFAFAQDSGQPEAAVSIDAAQPVPPEESVPSMIPAPVEVPIETASISQIDSSIPASPIERGIKQQIDLLDPPESENNKQKMVGGMRSLFYNTWEHDLIIDARRGITTGLGTVDEGDIPIRAITGVRDIALSGIVFVSQKEWTIWLNNTRITPNAIPKAIMDIKVFKDYIDVEWFDESTNQIFPIRLRPHQRFNLDTRIFLPG